MEIVEREPDVDQDYVKLSKEEKQKVKSIIDSIDINDTQLVIQYGVGAQSDISSFADTILSDIRGKDAGEVGEILTNLMVKVKDIDVDSLSEKTGLGKLFGGLKNAARKFISRYEKMSVNLEGIINELEKSRMHLLKDIARLDSLYKKNYDYLTQLDLFILAGQMKLKEIKENVLPILKSDAEKATDALDAQKYNDMVQRANRFEKKLHDLLLSRMIAIQTGPQIRLIQNNNQVLVEKVQSSILNTIPLWKNQIIIAISLFRQKKALKQQKEITKTTNNLLSRNAEMLKMGSIEVAKEAERGIVEIETLKKVNMDLISTIEETIKIQQEGRVKRQEAEIELKVMEKELKNKLIATKNETE